MIKRFKCLKDTSITNAYKTNLITRGTNSNLGASDILEVFSIYGRASTSSFEAMRSLLDFDLEKIIEERVKGKLPPSGSVSFYLRLWNAPHQETTPSNLSLSFQPLSQSFDEGYGLDMEGFSDVSTSGTLGASWDYASSGSSWTTPGGDFSGEIKNYYLTEGTEDLEVDITSIIENWISSPSQNHGIGVFLSGSLESEEKSYYTKRFFGRGSQFYLRRPVIEARWDDFLANRRTGFVLSSSRLSADDNVNTVFFYNYVRGALKDVPGISSGSEIYVRLFTSSSGGDEISTVTPSYPVTGGWYSTGVYTASYALETTASQIYDRWLDASGNTLYVGSITPDDTLFSNNDKFVTTIKDLKSVYSPAEGDVRFKVFIREKQWSPNIYSVTTANINHFPVEKSYYRIFRFVDDFEIVSYSTGSLEYSKMSIGDEYNYFDLDMNILEPGYLYGIQFLYIINGKSMEQPEIFKFRVE